MLGRIHAGATNGSSNVKYFTMDIPIELNDGMKVLVSNKMKTKPIFWNQPIPTTIQEFKQKYK